MSSSTHIYSVELDDSRSVMNVEAPSKGEARRFALKGVKVKRLSGGEIMDLSRRGVAIVSSATGKVCNGLDAGEGGES